MPDPPEGDPQTSAPVADGGDPHTPAPAVHDGGDPHTPAPAGAPEWSTLDLEGLRGRLVEIKDLLEQAAAVGLAQDADRLEAMAKIAARSRENGNAHHGRRRYR